MRTNAGKKNPDARFQCVRMNLDGEKGLPEVLAAADGGGLGYGRADVASLAVVPANENARDVVLSAVGVGPGNHLVHGNLEVRFRRKNGAPK